MTSCKTLLDFHVFEDLFATIIRRRHCRSIDNLDWFEACSWDLLICFFIRIATNTLFNILALSFGTWSSRAPCLINWQASIKVRQSPVTYCRLITFVCCYVSDSLRDIRLSMRLKTVTWMRNCARHWKSSVHVKSFSKSSSVGNGKDGDSWLRIEKNLLL